MKVFIGTVGSRGDVQPYVALGMGLEAAGHTVTVCTSSAFESFVTGHGLRYAYMNNDLVELLESDEGREAIERMTTPWGLFRTATGVGARATARSSRRRTSVPASARAAERRAAPEGRDGEPPLRPKRGRHR